MWHICPTANKVLDKVDCGAERRGGREGVWEGGVTPNERAEFSCRDQKRNKDAFVKGVK